MSLSLSLHPSRYASACCAAVLALASPVIAGETSFRGKGLTIELVSEVTAIRPGEPFYAGLWIRHDPKHHTYWRIPGLAGVPTRLEWALPAGWKAGEIEWPAPDKVKMGLIDTHGYERDVLLMARLTPPAQREGKAVTLDTTAVWMCCGVTCNPGFHKLSLELPIAASGAKEPAWNAAWHPVFEKERARFPGPLQGWKLTAVRTGKTVTLRGTPETKNAKVPQDPVFFTNDVQVSGDGIVRGLICSHAPQSWQVTDSGFTATLGVSDLPPKNPKVLRGVLTGKPGWLPGDPRAVFFEIPLETGKEPEAAKAEEPAKTGAR